MKKQNYTVMCLAYDGKTVVGNNGDTKSSDVFVGREAAEREASILRANGHKNVMIVKLIKEENKWTKKLLNEFQEKLR